MYKYLFAVDSAYNNIDPVYELDKLPQSTYLNALVFSGNTSKFFKKDIGNICIYLELPERLTSLNRYFNLQRLLNLVSLETVRVSSFHKVELSPEDTFDSVYSKYCNDNHYNENVSYHGLAPRPNHILRVKTLVQHLINLDENKFRKFDNSLNTFIWALEIQNNTNPHLKFSLYMTLLLSSIEQLSDDPKFCEHNLNCPKCGRNLRHHLANMGNRKMLELLIKEMLTGSGVDDAVKRVTRLYNDCRSPFLHAGNLYGQEKVGGYFSDIENNKELAEDEVNVVLLIVQLLEQFAVRRSET